MNSHSELRGLRNKNKTFIKNDFEVELVYAEWEHTILTVNYTSHCVSVFTVKCENGRFHWALRLSVML